MARYAVFEDAWYPVTMIIGEGGLYGHVVELSNAEPFRVERAFAEFMAVQTLLQDRRVEQLDFVTMAAAERDSMDEWEEPYERFDLEIAAADRQLVRDLCRHHAGKRQLVPRRGRLH